MSKAQSASDIPFHQSTISQASFSRRRMWIIGIAALLLIIAGIWLYPQARALYHQVRGGQYLKQVLETLEGADSVTTYCFSPALDENTRQMAQRARGHLERSLDYKSSYSHTYLQLGRIDCLLEDFDSTLEAYQNYTELRPDNPLGHVELGFVYEKICTTNGSISENEYCYDNTLLEQINEQWQYIDNIVNNFFITGEEYRQKGNYHDASLWFQRAALIKGEKINDIPKPLVNEINIIEDFATTSGWQECGWCENVDGQFYISNNRLEMWYLNTEKRDNFAYRWMINIPIDFSELIFYIKGNNFTILTIAIVIDNTRTRPIEYKSLSENWKIMNIPITGEYLQEILISISEAQHQSTPVKYHLSLDWIATR